MKNQIVQLIICLVLGMAVSAIAKPAAEPAQSSSAAETQIEKDLLQLSKDKWKWMADKKVDVLADLFHEKAVFVHMGGSMTRTQELETIKSGGIHYKEAQISKASARIIGTTAIVLNTIRLVAVVGGNEVVNPFEVTEVYVKVGEKWKLASLSFTRLMR